MSNANFAYPFDPQGTLPSNKITAENQIIAPTGLSEFLFILPAATPFFAESMRIVHQPSQRTLVEGQDYVLTHYFHDASLQCAKPIYGSITFLNNALGGAARLTYQTLGGDWTLNSEKIIDILSNKLINPRRVVWEQVADLPYAFPPIDHDWHLDDMVGMSETVEVLGEIRDALLASGQQGLAIHIADKNNPHNVTKAQVSLGSVDNYPTANVAEAQGGVVNNRFMTPLRTKQLVDALVGNTLDTHIGRSDNPHNTTKAQVGLDQVQNFPIATTAEAQAGVLDTRYLTPASGRALVTTLALTPLNTHIARIDNPHSVTKGQVGLGSVQNYAISDVVAARAGLANDLYMTPAMTREAIAAQAMTGISDHIDRTDNPHNVTKTQVGLGSVENFPTASQAEAEAGTASNRFLTPLRGKQMVDALVGLAFRAHENNSANPHGVTKAQVSLGNVDNYATASLAQAQAGLATNLFMTPAGTKALVEAMGGGGGGSAAGLAAHIADKENPHEVDAEQVGLGNVSNYATATAIETETGLSSTLFVTPAGVKRSIDNLALLPLNAHINRTDNPHNVTAAQLNVYTKTEINTQMSNKLGKTEKAADTTLFDGKTLAEVTASGRTVEVYPDPGLSGAFIWTKLGEITFPVVDAAKIPDLVGEVTGGDPSFYSISSTFRVRVSARQPSASYVTITTENYSRDIAFGVTSVDASGDRTIALYARTPANRAPFTVVALSQDTPFYKGTPDGAITEPADITYLSLNMPAFTRQRTQFGDLSFGDLPNNLNFAQITGGLVEWVSVVGSDADELTVQAIENQLKEDYSAFIPWSGARGNYQYDDLEIVDKWGWNETIGGILLDTATVTNTAMLTGNTSSTDYTFEVEISSTSTEANAAGVLAAVVTVGDRQHAISVLRTPGGMVAKTMGNTSFFKLLTVGLHVGQNDSVNIDSTNGTLKWSDTGAADDARDPTQFDPVAHGWTDAGAVKIRVNRTANILTIDVTDFGDTNYVAAEQIVIDFESQPVLSAFVDRASSVGVVSFQQPNVTFKVLERPQRYRDYVRTGVAADNGKQRLYRYNGGAWVMTYLGLNNPAVRPNRLYFSDWNGVLYQSQRNGRLRPILIEAYSRSNPTLLTT